MTSTQILTTSHQQLYKTDFVEWVDHAAELLNQGRFNELDLENLIDEVETLGRSEKNAMRSNLRILLMHLLKWQYQPSKRTRSWEDTIIEHRIRIQNAFEDSPSLKNFYASIFDKAYGEARKRATGQTGLDIKTFPTDCPYTKEQTTDDNFLPEG